MARNNNNVRAFSDSRIYYGALGSALPTDLTTDPTTLGLLECGLLTDSGTTESHAYGNETSVFDASGSLVRVLRSQESRTFGFSALETNPNVDGLIYPTATSTVSGATAEVQQIAISGSPTGGTFNVVLSGYGAATTLAYNISNSALATALSSAFGFTVTVSGSAFTYNVTFPTSVGNVPQMTTVSQLTGGTSPSIAVSTTTPGVGGLTTTPVGAATGRYLNTWVIDEFDGSYHERYTVASGEATQSGDVSKSPGAATEYAFTLETYKDSSGFFFVKYHN